jgi:hypothetical protein
MMELCPFFVVLLCATGSDLVANEPTWVEIDKTVYGAKPDERGPIGGGTGYRDTVTRGTCTADNLDALLETLSQVKTGQTIFIPGETEIDLTARIYIDQLVLDIPEGVTLAGNRGHDGSLGALLTSDALNTPVMIRAGGPNVRITGLRLRGPNPKRYLDHHRRSFSPGGAGRPYYYKLPVSDGITTRHPRLEVDNCEISGFSHAAVYLTAGKEHHIHHNYIHHCQYQGLGYGISHDIAYSLIECNLFDWNRHSIAGTGRPGSGYVACHNVELGVSLSHCFDMHGGRDRQDGTDIAGTSIEIRSNTFRAGQTPVVIRGVPEDKCDVRRNWFVKHQGPSQAVQASERTEVHDNAYGREPATVK